MATGHLFVYGTLRPGSGHPLAARLARAMRWVGRARWNGTLWECPDHPAAVSAGPDEGDEWVVGDLYAFEDEADLAELDAYEDCGPGGALGPLGFVREHQPVWREDGTVVLAWMYRFARPLPPGARRVASGDWSLLVVPEA